MQRGCFRSTDFTPQRRRRCAGRDAQCVSLQRGRGKRQNGAGHACMDSRTAPIEFTVRRGLWTLLANYFPAWRSPRGIPNSPCQWIIDRRSQPRSPKTTTSSSISHVWVEGYLPNIGWTESIAGLVAGAMSMAIPRANRSLATLRVPPLTRVGGAGVSAELAPTGNCTLRLRYFA